MRWFRKEKPRDIWDEAIESPLGDIEAAERIRNICRSAADSADFVGGRADEGKRGVQRKHEDESARFQRAGKAAMEIAMKISDELMRDAAVREIVELCLRANDTRTSRILFRAIQTPSIRDGMLADHPALKQ
jgi:hypothetical protein